VAAYFRFRLSQFPIAGEGWGAGTCSPMVVYMATLPLEANVQLMTVMATKIPISARAAEERHPAHRQLQPTIA